MGVCFAPGLEKSQLVHAGKQLGTELAVAIIVPVVFLLARAESGLFASCVSGSTTTSLVASRADLLMMHAELFECLICVKKLVWKNLGEPGNKSISLIQYAYVFCHVLKV